jgi:PPOX class probable F420-dependent enzyme
MGGFETLVGKRYLNLETCRRNGQGVRTPVWFAADPGDDSTLYVYSLSQSGKAKRIRGGGAVRVAACNATGSVTGPWIDAQASIVDGEALRHGMQLINRKYRPWKQILDLFARFRRHDARIGIVIRSQNVASPGRAPAAPRPPAPAPVPRLPGA